MLTPLKPGETYASAADIRDCDDLPVVPFCPGERMADGSFAPYWTRPDGTALIVRVRAPSLAERRLIEQAVPDENDSMGWVLETCFYCLVEPKLTKAQISDVLSTKHPGALIQISDQAWQLAALPASVLTTALRELAGLPSTPPAAAADPPAPRKRARPKRAPRTAAT